MEKHFHVYLMTNRRNGTLYCGVTSDLARRAYEHKTGGVEGFTSRYDLKLLVWFEEAGAAHSAIQREKTIKGYPRAFFNPPCHYPACPGNPGSQTKSYVKSLLDHPASLSSGWQSQTRGLDGDSVDLWDKSRQDVGAVRTLR